MLTGFADSMTFRSFFGGIFDVTSSGLQSTAVSSAPAPARGEVVPHVAKWTREETYMGVGCCRLGGRLARVVPPPPPHRGCQRGLQTHTWSRTHLDFDALIAMCACWRGCRATLASFKLALAMRSSVSRSSCAFKSCLNLGRNGGAGKGGIHQPGSGLLLSFESLAARAASVYLLRPTVSLSF